MTVEMAAVTGVVGIAMFLGLRHVLKGAGLLKSHDKPDCRCGTCAQRRAKQVQMSAPEKSGKENN